MFGDLVALRMILVRDGAKIMFFSCYFFKLPILLIITIISNSKEPNVIIKWRI